MDANDDTMRQLLMMQLIELPVCHASAACPGLVASTSARRLCLEHEIVDVPLARQSVAKENLRRVPIARLGHAQDTLSACLASSGRSRETHSSYICAREGVEAHLPNMLVVRRPTRRERMRIGVLGTRVRVVRDLRVLDRLPRPHLQRRHTR